MFWLKMGPVLVLATLIMTSTFINGDLNLSRLNR